MIREHVEKLNSSPEWKSAFEGALAKAEALPSVANWDALAYATTSADLAVANAEEAKARTAQHDAAILADHRARQTLAAHQPAPTPTPQPDPAVRAKAGWAAAAAKLNGVAGTEQVPTTAENAPAFPPADGGKSGWTTAVAAINAERGV